jgi:hypothetical protein
MLPTEAGFPLISELKYYLLLSDFKLNPSIIVKQKKDLFVRLLDC